MTMNVYVRGALCRAVAINEAFGGSCAFPTPTRMLVTEERADTVGHSRGKAS